MASCFLLDSGGYIRPGHISGPLRIENVVEWDIVIHRYLAIKGQEEDIDLGLSFDDDGLLPGEESSSGNAEQTPKTNGIKNNHLV